MFEIICDIKPEQPAPNNDAIEDTTDPILIMLQKWEREKSLDESREKGRGLKRSNKKQTWASRDSKSKKPLNLIQA